MNTLESLSQEIDQIKSRNARVEQNKAWETSKTRRFVVALLTYIVVVLFFLVINVGNAWLNAIVPTIGFLISTFSVSLLKKIWIQRVFENRK
jgi:polyferredoxin